jgi:hypothetical protein
MVNNETVAIINKAEAEIVGFFTLTTKDNYSRYFVSNDVFGLIGLEIVKLYETLYGQA